MNSNLPYVFSVPTDWSRDFYCDKGPVIPAARPFTLLHEPRAEKAVLLVHGFTGYPGELVRPAEDLYEKGFDCFVPRLPGHGTTGKDFISSGQKDWVGVAENALVDLLGKYKEVSVVGHSMGGAIAALIVSRHPEVKGAVLCCPGIELENMDKKTARILSVLSLFVKKMKKEWQSDPRYHLHYEGAPKDDEKLGEEYWKFLYPRNIVSLLRIAESAKAGLPDIKVRTLIIGAEKDALVVPDSVYTIQKAIGDRAETLLVKDATHYVYYDISQEAEETAVKATVEFLQDKTSRTL